MAQRRDLIFGLLELLGGTVPVETLHHGLFLFGRRVKKPPYFFVPTSCGPWSFQLEADLKKVSEQGRAEEREEGILLRGRSGTFADLDEQSLHALQGIIREKNLPLKEALLQEALQKDPFQGIRLERDRLDELLSEGEREAIEDHRPRAQEKALFTIGYEGRPLETYLSELLKQGVNALCDVRKDPVSRKFGFSKKMLIHASSVCGMSYCHLPEFGIPKEERKEIDSEEARQTVLDRYEQEKLPHAGDALGVLERTLGEQDRIALTCYESDPGQCHRSRISKALKQKRRDLPVEHL